MNIYQFTCKGCGVVEAAQNKTGPRRIYCSTKCRRDAEYRRNGAANNARRRGKRNPAASASPVARIQLDPRLCKRCASSFLPRIARQVYCSRACNRNAGRESLTALCALEGCENRVRAKGLCSNHYNATLGTWRDRIRDYDKVRRSHNAHLGRRRARIHDPEAERIVREDIGERDGWVCGICLDAVAPELRWPDPQSQSLDHVVPLSLGGLHRATNVRIAHLTCNVRRGNRVDA